MKKKIFFLTLFVVLLLPAIFVSPAVATTRILLLGDSITQGASSGEPDLNLQTGYREALWQMLIDNEYDVDFVGSRNSGSAIAGFDPDHEGHPGWTDAEIVDGRLGSPAAGKLDQWLADFQPDIVLLHIGTNGLADPVSADDVERILDVIDSYETQNGVDVWVILARIINRLDHVCPQDSLTTRFNDSVEIVAQDRIDNPSNPAYPDKIIIVDMECGAGIDYTHKDSGGDMEDSLHPYQYGSGYDKMASIWFSALENILQVSIPFAPTITTSPQTTATIGIQYTYNVTAVGSPSPSYFLTDFPAGMTINETTGHIEWTPAAPGDVSVTVEARNGELPNAVQTFSIDVIEITTLVSGESQSDSISQGDWRYYTIDASDIDSEIVVELANLTNDLDLYVRAGDLPTLSDYDCRPYLGDTNAETCTLPNAGATTWYIGVHGYSAGSYSIEATVISTTVLSSGVPESSSVAKDQWRYYQIDATDTDIEVVAELTNLTNDLDLYVRAGALPTLSDYDCRPYLGDTNAETCTLPNSGATTWYIGVNGYSAGSYTIEATLSGSGGGPTVLTSGVPEAGSVVKDQWRYYQIDATDTDIEVVAELTNLSADVDLYVRAGDLPTLSDYDCRPYQGGTDAETCTLPNSGATTWYIGVNGYKAGSYTIEATLNESGSGPTVLVSGVPEAGSVAKDQWQYYQIDAIDTDIEVIVELTNLSADVDLYVRAGALPTLSDYDCRPYQGGTDAETCALPNSGATTWYIGVNGYNAGSYTIEATVSGALLLTSGVPEAGSVVKDQWRYYQIDATDTDIEVVVELTNLSADVDLYVRAGALPTLSDYDCRPYQGGTDAETCTLPNSGATNWYIGVHGFKAGSYNIEATLQGG